MASYAYYHKDRPILSDGQFDELAKTMLENWDDIQHVHKHHITEGDLEAGTLLLARESYPSLAVHAAESLIKENNL